MTSDKNYLGEGNVDKFDALFFKLRQFVPDDQGENYFFCIGNLSNLSLDSSTFLEGL